MTEHPDAAPPKEPTVTEALIRLYKAVQERKVPVEVNLWDLAAVLNYLGESPPPLDAAQQFVFHARVALGIWLDGKKKTEIFEQAMEALDDASAKLEKPPPSDAAPCPTCGKFDHFLCLDIYYPQREGHVYKDGVLQPSDAAQHVQVGGSHPEERLPEWKPSDAAQPTEVELLRRMLTNPQRDMPLVTESCGCRWLGLWVLPCFEHIQLFVAHPEDAPGGSTRLQILEAQRELTAADVAFPCEDGTFSLLLSDTFAFASADAEKIPDDEVVRLAQLYKDHGWDALCVWAEDKRGQRVLKPLRKAVDEMRDRLKGDGK